VNWEAVGAIGDFVSGAAVLLTLVYLLVQTRQANEQLKLNVEALRVAAVEFNIAAGQRSRELLIAHPDAAHLLERGLRDLDSVEESDRFRFDLLIQNLIYGYESAYYRLDEDELNAMLPILDRVFWGEGGRAWWQKRRSDFRPEFREFVDARIQSRWNSQADGPE